MRLLTLDASVICKWYLDPSVEADVEAAHAIAVALRARQIAAIQPPHWLAEVAAITARLLPDEASAIVHDLAALELAVKTGDDLYQHAVQLSIDTGAHPFDTLYHAVVLQSQDGVLVTADRRYFEAARRFGQVLLLDELSIKDMEEEKTSSTDETLD